MGLFARILDGPRKGYALASIIIGLVVTYEMFDWTRWWLLDGRVQGRIVVPIARPSLQDVLALRGRIDKEAKELWIPEGAIELDMHCEQHLSNGFALTADQSEIFWFLVVRARYHGRKALWEQRLDNRLPATDGEALESAGIKVLRRD